MEVITFVSRFARASENPTASYSRGAWMEVITLLFGLAKASESNDTERTGTVAL